MKNPANVYFCMLLALVFLSSGCSQNPGKKTAADYKITPVSFTDVKLHDAFWLPRILKNTEVTIPIAFQQSEETGRIKNFEVAGGLVPGSFCSIYPFDDSDVFKIMEGASYSLMVKPDPALEAYLDTLIYKISLAQEPDGYLYTNRTILGDSAHEWAGTERWQHVNEHSHELYNVGHMYEAAVAHYMATGKRTFLDIAIKNADLVCRDFGWGKIEKYPGHQEIEIGLVKLYRATGDIRYLDQAKFFLDVRGPGGWEYNQAHLKVTDQRDPVGHAVRAMYMFSGMVDIASLTNNPDYLQAVGALWINVMKKKIYITGGIGQSGGNEGFGKDYDLPNMSAYCETCASIASVFWNYRMFLLTGDPPFIDMMERTMYNALLSGVSLTGDRFFYPNPLESDGRHQRQEWFGCACCPSNISRFLPSVPGYIYAREGSNLFVNLYIASEARFQAPSGNITLEMQTEYPWDGHVSIRIQSESEDKYTVNLRIPSWAENRPVWGDLYKFYDHSEEVPEILVNGTAASYKMVNGYVALKRKWKAGDLIELNLPMPVRKVLAHDSVLADRGRFTLQRGPLVYCLEAQDQDEPSVRFVVADIDGNFTTAREEDLLGGITTIEFYGWDVNTDMNGNKVKETGTRHLKAIPYSAWANRGPGEMLVWIPYETSYATSRPAPTIAWRSKKTSSGARGDLNLLSDQYDPVSSSDPSMGYIHWWPENDTTEWIIYEFEQPEAVDRVSIYWFDDGPDGGCRIPAAWELFYRDKGEWKPVDNSSPYAVTRDGWDSLTFKPVMTDALKLEVKLQKEYSSGVHEWSVGE